MNKRVILSVAALATLYSTSSAADSVNAMFSEGKVSGQIRSFNISRTIEDTRNTANNDYTRKANAIGGHLKYETASLNGLSLGAAFYTTNGYALEDDRSTNREVDPTLLGKDNDGYSILGEAYLQYKRSNTTLKVGRQKLNTPLAGADDARMLPNLFEAALLVNTDIEDTTIIAAHATKFAQGTFGRAYVSGALSATAGYSSTDARNQVGEFVNMGTYAVGTATDGVSILSATYSGIENLKLQVWDYMAHDILNAVYAQADFKWKCKLSDSAKPFASAQYIGQNDIGDSLAGDIKGTYWAAKAGAKVENFTAYLAYSQSSANSSGQSLQNAIVSPWGGMPAFTQGMVTRHMFLAGTKATKVAASYNWKAYGPNLKTVAYYATFDMDANNGYTNANASESGFDFIYHPEQVKGLQLRLRGNYANDFYTAAAGAGTVSWNEYRFIVNYNF